jgi:1-acyl-sn-glycerol-3-phosphate acyltransferase
MMNEAPASPPGPSPLSHESPGAASGSSFWHKYFHRWINSVYFQRISLIHRERLAGTGPVLYLGLHRNGAVDGFVYRNVLREPVFMISTQLRKNWFTRLFFHGIAVTRTRDEGDRDLNEVARRRCLEHLRAGGELFVFPEGTSSLGPQHLPFKSGAAWLLLDYLDGGGPPLRVIPLGIHYECPWAFCGKVEVVVGMPISTELPMAASRIGRLRIVKRRIQSALEEVGINVPSDEYQAMIQRFACVAILGTGRSYFQSLKAMERAVPKEIMDSWQGLEPDLHNARLWFHQGVPLFPAGPLALSIAALFVISPVVLAAMAMNLPALAAGRWAGRTFPDDRNVISLWKILVGVPVFTLWAGVVGAVLIGLGQIWWLALYAATSGLGLKLYHQFKKLAVAVHNGLRYPALRPRVLAFRQTVLQSLSDETI